MQCFLITSLVLTFLWFREEVSLLWGWGVSSLHRGGLFQRWASLGSSPRGPFTATSNEYTIQLLFLFCDKQTRKINSWSSVSCINIVPLQLVRRCILGSILESEKNYLDALKKILEVCQYGRSNYWIHFEAFVIAVNIVCFISNMRSPYPRLSRGYWVTGNWRWPSTECVRSCSATSCSRSHWRAVWRSGTAWRWSVMSLWHR